MDGFFLTDAHLKLSPYIGQYDPAWVLASVLIAVLSSTCAMEMSRRLNDVASRRLWLPLIALVMGTGIWSMHFVGMLAFKLDCTVNYNPWLTGLSMLPGMAAAVVALNDTGRNTALRSTRSFVVPACILAVGIGVMHYAGMAAMVFNGVVRYEPVLFVCSLLLAAVLSFVALRINHAFAQRTTLRMPFLVSLGSGTALALAISGVHYTAMEAAYFMPVPALNRPDTSGFGPASPDVMAAWVVWVALGLALSCLLLTFISMRFAAARRRIDAILAASNQSFVQMDQSGRITDCNAAMAQLWGEPREALVGRHFYQLFEGLPPTPDTVNPMEAVLVRPGQPGLPCLVTYNEVTTDTGQVLYAFAWLADLSARWRAQELLTMAKQQAESAARMKSDFLSNMSHEIRTPMNAIMGMTHLVQNTPLNPKQRAYLQKIEGASQHLLGIINDILDISKIEAGKMAIEQTAFTLEALMARVLDLVGEKARDKGLGLKVDIAPDVPQLLLGDPLRLSQILVNYANNAIKFTSAGEVIIRVECVQAKPALGLAPLGPGQDIVLKFSVQDTGIGMDQEAMDRLFQSFQQADTSTTRRFGGTGLGLAISKQLAGLMHGDVGVSSTLGQGSTFWFTARLQAARSSDVKPGIAEALAPKHATPRRGLRVLLVEDNPINQQVGQEILEEAGALVTVAGDGAQAVSLLGHQRFDLVLMDMQMPVMDGLEATRRIRAMPGLASLPVVAMTANAMQSSINECLQAGMNDHLAKPMDPKALRHMMARMVPDTTPPEVSPAVPMAAPAEPPALPLNLLPQIEGLDTGAGLRRVMGKSALYSQLLRQFAASEADFEARLRQAMAQQDWLQARHVVHTLKGVAATLGAQAVEAQCAQLEHGLQAAQPQASQLEPLALTLGHTLGTLIRAISQAELPLEARSVSHTNHHTPAATHQETRDNTAELAPGVAQALPPAQELADEQGLERLRTIIKLARESDASALDMMQEHCENLEKIWPQATQRAVELLSNYDFPEAADVLEAAIQAKP